MNTDDDDDDDGDTRPVLRAMEAVGKAIRPKAKFVTIMVEPADGEDFRTHGDIRCVSEMYSSISREALRTLLSELLHILEAK